MVGRILRALHAPVAELARPIFGLHQAAYLLALLALASQALALIRDRIFAHSFGAGHTLDLYYAAFKVPDLVFALVASLVSAYVLIPRLAGSENEKARILLSQATSFFVIAGGVLSIILWFFIPDILRIAFPKFVGFPEASQFVFLARLLLLQPILLGLSGILSSVTQLHRRFTLYALSPVLYNLGIIAGTIFLYPAFGLVGIGIGVLIGAFLHLLIHIPIVLKADLFPRPLFPSATHIWRIVKDSVPRTLALAMGALTLLALSALAASLGEGGIAVFSLAGNLQAVPLSLVGASYATAAFPVLARHIGEKQFAAFVETLSAAGRHLIFWSTIITALVIVLRAHIVRVVLGTGAFDWNDTRLTAAALAIFIIALVAQGIVLLASRAFYAANRSWQPFLIQVLGALVSISVAFWLVSFAGSHPEIRYFIEALFRVEDVPGSSILLVVLGVLAGQLIMLLLTLLTLSQVAPGVATSYARPLGEGIAAGVVGAAAAYLVLILMGQLAPLTTLLAVLIQACLSLCAGLGAAAAVLILLDSREFWDLYESLKKIKGVKALLPFGAVESSRTES